MIKHSPDPGTNTGSPPVLSTPPSFESVVVLIILITSPPSSVSWFPLTVEWSEVLGFLSQTSEFESLVHSLELNNFWQDT